MTAQFATSTTAAPEPTLVHRRARVTLGIAVLAVVAVNACVIVWLWWQNNSASTFRDLADLLTSMGDITGLLAAYLLLLQVLLLARLPFVETLLGFDRLTIWHRRNGKIALYLVIAHVVLITLGFALNDRVSILKEITLLFTLYPGMITATAGTVLLITVVVLSLVIVRRRLRYETWYLVHLTAYAGIILGWFHQIPTGTVLAADPTAAAYWTALYLVTLALLVLCRFGRPALTNLAQQLRVAAVHPEGPGVVSLRIAGRRLDKLGAKPGQFFLWRFLDRSRWYESHPFSLSAVPSSESLRITVKDSGDFTSRIEQILPGTRVLVEGPFGVFTDAVRRCDGAVLIAGGIGITPIRALAEQAPGGLIVIVRAIGDEDVIFRHELDRLAHTRDITVHYVIGDHAEPGNRHLLSSQHLHDLVPDIQHRDVYICGPPALADLVERSIRALNVPRKHIHIERFAL